MVEYHSGTTLQEFQVINKAKLSDYTNLNPLTPRVKGVRTYVAMVILVAMHCSTRARPFGVKVEFHTSIFSSFSVLGNRAYSI